MKRHAPCQRPKCPHCLGRGRELAEEDHERIGAKLKKQRLALNLRAVDVAKHMGISAAHMSYLERGLRPWSLSLKEKYEAALKQ